MSSGSVYPMSVTDGEGSQQEGESNREEERKEEDGSPPPSWKKALVTVTLPTYALPWDNHQELIKELKKIYQPEKKSR